MLSLDETLLAAWERTRPKLLADPNELARRLARRRGVHHTRPPRSMCLCVRASDTRINIATAVIAPEHAVQLNSREHPDRCVEHEVTLDARLIRRLCCPQTTQAPGQVWDEVAQMMGTHPLSLYKRRLNGVFQTHHVKGLMGRPGKPVPMLYSPRDLDPSAHLFAAPDAVWLKPSEDLLYRLEDTFRQTLTRLPVYRCASDIYRRLSATHPEAAEPSEPTPRDRRRLPAPAPDYVWYKWKDGKYVGDPAVERWRERRRRSRKPAPPAPSRSGGSEQFRGWCWRCPACGRTARKIYLPLHYDSPIVRDLKCRKPRLVIPSIAPSIEGLACARCHRVRAFSRVSKDFWNEVVTYLSGGLLFGREARRPDWVTCDRKRQFAPRPTFPPSVRRPQVQDLLLEGLKYHQIASRLNLKKSTIIGYANKIYAQHGVHSRADLAKKLGVPVPPKMPRTRTSGRPARPTPGALTSA